MFLLNKLLVYPAKKFLKARQTRQEMVLLISPIDAFRIHQIERKSDPPRGQQLCEGNFEHSVPRSGLIGEPHSFREILQSRDDEVTIAREVVVGDESNDFVDVVVEDEFHVVLPKPFRIPLVQHDRSILKQIHPFPLEVELYLKIAALL